MSETKVPEASIRDSLAKNLEVLEPGLKLIAVEYELTNPIGSKGFIDILAKDRFNNRVVIELKRSDTAARQAIHEIFKYFGLYQQQNATADHTIRCFVVSTTWWELKAPFQTLLQQTTMHVQGFAIDIDDKGNVVRSQEIPPSGNTVPFKLFRSHDIYLFEEKEKRDSTVELVADCFTRAGGESGLLLTQDYEGKLERIRYRHSIYVVLASIKAAVAEELKALCLEEDEDFDLKTQEGEASLQGQFAIAMHELMGHPHDTFEIGYPEKFVAMRAEAWKSKSVRRLGKVPDQSAIDDQEMLDRVAGTGGENAVMYQRFATPRIPLAWKQIPNELEFCLRGNTRWKAGAEWILQWIEDNCPKADVSIYVYNLQDWLISLFKALRGQPDYLPQLDIVVRDDANNRMVVLHGHIVWDGVTHPESLESVFTEGIGGFDNALDATLMKSSWLFDDDVLARHGLHYALFFGEQYGDKFTSREIEIANEEGKPVRKDAATPSVDLDKFVGANEQYLFEFMDNMLAKTTLGMM